MLVTAVGGDLGQSIIKCLRDSWYAPIITGIDMNGYAGGRSDVDTFYKAPGVRNEIEYTQFINGLIEKEGINFIFPMSEVEIDFFNRNRNKGLFPSEVNVVINDSFIIDTFIDKYKTIEFFKDNGLAFPKTFLWKEGEKVDKFDTFDTFPVILKRRKGSGSQGLFIIHDKEEMEFYLKRYPDSILQEYIPGDDNEYTSGIFSDGTVSHIITFKRILSPGGYSQQVELVTDENVNELPKQIANILASKYNFKGSLNVQYRFTERGGIPFEINPRFSSTVYFRHLFQFRDVEWVLNMMEGKPVEYIPSMKRGVGVRKLNEVLFEHED